MSHFSFLFCSLQILKPSFYLRTRAGTLYCPIFASFCLLFLMYGSRHSVTGTLPSVLLWPLFVCLFVCLFVFKGFVGPGELSQWLRALTALLEDLALIPCTHVSAYKHLGLSIPGDPTVFSGLRGYQAHKWCTDLYSSKTPIHGLKRWLSS